MTEYMELVVDKFTFKVAVDRFYTIEGVWAHGHRQHRADRPVGFFAAAQRGYRLCGCKTSRNASWQLVMKLSRLKRSK